jgi:hypothetical protein
MGIFDGSPDYGGGWTGLLQQGLQIGASIYTGQLQKKAVRKQAKAQAAGGAGEFTQLGMGLAATGPQRSNPFYTPDSPMGQVMSYFGGDAMPDDSGGTSSVGVMGRGRFPTQLIVYTTPSGRMQVGGYRSIGTPLLWSGDFAAVKRVARVARKLGRFVHRRPR